MTKNKELKIIFLDSQRGSAAPFVVKGLKKAFVNLGAKVTSIDLTSFDARSNFSCQEYNKLVQKINRLNADFIISYGVIRLNADNYSLIKDINCAYISLFYDNPLMYFQQMEKQEFSSFLSSNKYYIFCTDKEFLNDLTKIGFKKLEYLPLATDPDVFNYEDDKKKLTPFISDISFVGSILDNPEKVVQKRRLLWSKLPVLNKIIDDIVDSNNNVNSQEISEKLKSFKAKMDWNSYIIFCRTVFEEANTFIRINTLKSIEKYRVSVFGNKGWKKYLSGNMQFKGGIDYSKDLPLLYNASKINFNITNPQLINAITQRIFDVSSCQAFVISDKRADLKNLFGDCIVTYSDKKDMNEKIEFFLKNSSERQSRAACAQKIVFKKHKWIDRANTIIDYYISNRRG